MMKKILFSLVAVVLPGFVVAGSVSFVYKDKETVLNGKPWIGTQTKEGALISATNALSSSGTLYVGETDGTLFMGKLSRLDNDLDVSLIRKADPVVESDLVEAHKKRADSFLSFLPSEESLESFAVTEASPAPEVHSGEVFQIKINDETFEGETIELPVKYKKSKIKVDVVNVSTKPLWRVEMKMKADPKLSFWKRGRARGLNDVPRPVFRHSYQAMFRQLKTNDSFSVPVEIHYIKEESYNLTVTLKSKMGDITQKIPIRFIKS